MAIFTTIDKNDQHLFKLISIITIYYIIYIVATVFSLALLSGPDCCTHSGSFLVSIKLMFVWHMLNDNHSLSLVGNCNCLSATTVLLTMSFLQYT